MDWRKAAAADLREYRYIRDSIDNLRGQIEELERQAHTLKGTAYDRTPVKGGTSGWEDRLIGNIDRRGRLGENLRAVQAKVARIERGLAALTDRERRVLDGFYVDRRGQHVERLCEELGYEERNIYNIKDEALKKFTLSMYGIVDL